jgi:hypothetical protein
MCSAWIAGVSLDSSWLIARWVLVAACYSARVGATSKIVAKKQKLPWIHPFVLLLRTGAKDRVLDKFQKTRPVLWLMHAG